MISINASWDSKKGIEVTGGCLGDKKGSQKTP